MAVAQIASLAILARITRRDRVHGNSLAYFEEVTGGCERAEFVDYPHRFMPERQFMPIANGACHGVGIGRANQRGGRADDGIGSSWARDRLFHHADFAHALHNEALHRLGHGRLVVGVTSFSTWRRYFRHDCKRRRLLWN
jgi:hypothetical protein